MEGNTETQYQEYADFIEPEAVGVLSLVAVSECMADSRKRVWALRRDALLHRIRVVEMNLDYDLATRGIKVEVH